MDLISSLSALPGSTVLANGIRVFFRQTPPSGLVSVQVWVKSGSVHEGEFLGSGISHYLEHMVFKGTEKFSSEAITKKVQALGGSMNAYTTFSRTVYHVDLPAESAETAFDVLSQMTLFPRLDAEDARSEKDVILREIAMGEDDPDQRLAAASLETVFRVHPLRFPIIGKRDLFERLGAEELKTYFKNRYACDTIYLVVAGDLPESLVFELAEKYFGPAPASVAREVLVPDEPAQLAPRELTLRGDVKILRGNLLWRIPDARHPDAPALSVLAALLGKGDSALLWTELHEKRELVHGLSASAWQPTREGVFWISYDADLGKRAAVEAAVFESIERIVREGVSPALLNKVARLALVSQIDSRRTVASSAAALGREAVELGEPGIGGVFLERVRALTPEAIRSVAEKYLHREACTLAVYEEKAPESSRKASGSEAEVASSPQAFETLRLANGVRLLLQPVAGFPKVHWHASLRAGGLFEDENTKGASALLSTLLTQDAGGRTASEVAEAIESVGGSFDENCGANSLSLVVETLSEDCALACEILRNALLDPHFTEANFQRERDTQLAALRCEFDDVDSWARLVLHERFFGKECPLGTHVYGTEASLAKLTLADVERLYERLVVPENLVVAVSGDFDREEIFRLAETAFGQFSGKSALALPAAQPPALPEGPREEKCARDGEQAIVQLAFPGVGFSDERRFAALFTEALLSGMASRLFDEVREKRGLAYFVGAMRSQAPEYGMFALYAGTEKSKTEEVFAVMREELERLRRGEITEEEMNGVKTRLRVARRSARQRASVRAAAAAKNVLYGLPANFDEAFEARIEALAPADIADFVAACLRPEHAFALTVA